MRWIPLSIVLALCVSILVLPAASATSVTVTTCDPCLGQPPW